MEDATASTYRQALTFHSSSYDYSVGSRTIQKKKEMLIVLDRCMQNIFEDRDYRVRGHSEIEFMLRMFPLP